MFSKYSFYLFLSTIEVSIYRIYKNYNIIVPPQISFSYPTYIRTTITWPIANFNSIDIVWHYFVEIGVTHPKSQKSKLRCFRSPRIHILVLAIPNKTPKYSRYPSRYVTPVQRIPTHPPRCSSQPEIWCSQSAPNKEQISSAFVVNAKLNYFDLLNLCKSRYRSWILHSFSQWRSSFWCWPACAVARNGTDQCSPVSIRVCLQPHIW